jgi:carbohydrate-selective porin OprB
MRGAQSAKVAHQFREFVLIEPTQASSARKRGVADRRRDAAARRGMRRMRLGLVTVALSALLCSSAGHAQAPGDPASAVLQTALDGTEAPQTGSEDTGLPLPLSGLLSAFHRQRQLLKDDGITFKLHEQSEVWANLAGGGKQGFSYNGLTIAKLDVDLDKVMGWSGAEIFVEAFDIHGHGPSRSLVGNLQLVSNAEASSSVKLYDLWLDQTVFDGKLSIRLGQEGANDEMMTTAYGGLFFNSSFGFPGIPAAVLPSGGPNFPIATPFVRAQLKANDNLTLISGVFNGDPAPPGAGDPQIRDRNGTAFRLDGNALALAEIWYAPDPGAAAYRGLGNLRHRRSEDLAAWRLAGSGGRDVPSGHGRTRRPQSQQSVY